MAQEKRKLREWIPSATNQIRLRHLRQVCGRRVVGPGDSSCTVSENCCYYYTLHITLMSAPFYTSETAAGENLDWSDVDFSKFPENIVTSCPGVVVRLWCRDGLEFSSSPVLVTVWGVFFSGLVYLGSQLPKEGACFANNTLVFGMSWGYFVSSDSFRTLFIPPTYPMNLAPAPGYKVSTMCRIHRMQRAIYKQQIECERLRQEIQLAHSHPSRQVQNHQRGRSFSGASMVTPEDRQLLMVLRTKRQAAVARVAMLQCEWGKQLRVVEQLKETLKNLRVDNHTRALHVKEKEFHLQIDKERLSSLVTATAGTEEAFVRLKQQLAFRRRQLFHELHHIFPIVQGANGLHTISDVELPDSEKLTGHDETQLSVALGHVAHLVHMISIFLQVPNRYPVFVCSSRSRIMDPVNSTAPAAGGAPSSSSSSSTSAIAASASNGAGASQAKSDGSRDNRTEFPLFAKGKDRLFFEYAVYLLNKNVAQLRCYCHLNTQHLDATLPNLASLMHRLLLMGSEPLVDQHRPDSRAIQRGWSLSQETLNCSTVDGVVAAVAGSAAGSMGGGAGSVAPRPRWKGHRATRSLGGSEMSLTCSMTSLDRHSVFEFGGSPNFGGGGYFKQPPPIFSSGVGGVIGSIAGAGGGSSCTSCSSLDLLGERLSLATPPPPLQAPPGDMGVELASEAASLASLDVSLSDSPAAIAASSVDDVDRSDLTTAQATPSSAGPAPPTVAVEKALNLVDDDAAAAAAAGNLVVVDDVMDDVSARTQALADTASSFKLKNRRRLRSVQL